MYTDDLYAKIKVRSSIYNSDVPWEPPKSAAELRIDALSAELEARKRGKVAPSNAALPRTSAWAAELPRDVQPKALLRSFGSIANLLAKNWDAPIAMRLCFSKLLGEHGTKRKEFPPEVRHELLALRQFYFDRPLERSGKPDDTTGERAWEPHARQVLPQEVTAARPAAHAAWTLQPKD